MTCKFNPGDVEITELTLYAKNGRFHLHDTFVEISIFEDMFRPFITANITLNDSVGLLKAAPILGGERIVVEFNTPDRSGVKYELFVNSIDDTHQVKPLNAGYVYTLSCASEELHMNASKRVSKVYTGEISNIVSTLVKEDLGSKKNLFYDKTMGTIDYSLHDVSPVGYVQRLSKMAVSLKDQSSTYVFFENHDGFHFETLETFAELGAGKIGDKTFVSVPHAASKEVGSPEEFRHIINLMVGDVPSLSEDISSGMLNSETTTFDMITKRTDVSKFNIVEKITGFKTLDESTTSLIRTPKSIVEKYGNTPTTSYYRIKDSSSREDFVDSMLSNKLSYAMLTLQAPIILNVHGDSELRVSDVIGVRYPKASGNPAEMSEEERFTSGNHLVVRLRHYIIKDGDNPKYLCAMEAVTFYGEG